MTYQIPIIDFKDFETRSAEIAKEVYEACTTIGFFYVANHGIPQEMIDDAFALSKQYYDLPFEVKDQQAIKDNRGYTGLYVQKLDPDRQRQGDHKEAFNFGAFRNGDYAWPLPEIFKQNKDQLEGFSRRCHASAMNIMEAMAIALEIPEKDGGKSWFTRAHVYDSPNSAGTLRFLKYPHGAESTYKEPVRAGAHTDYGTITLLFQKDIGGLEVQASRTEWISAPIIEGTILVNVGGMFEYWTNGLFKSTMHRVVFRPEHQEYDRYSIAFFCQADGNFSLDPIPSKLIPEERPASGEIPADKVDKITTARDYLEMRLQAAYAARPQAV
ncbi:oxidoreductase [Lichtheimia corymbifera JMRC:FSU:9682]|uniref:Oxidoreductase n=1 Tax=Lichtheimia corymbifera JMRC:FSU:9682 TaxID=1263082 RepID=A0A068RK03_9FUNG|nr:oxidoreductase [Lichtheimia corymbifera JMRC:FSU:9682]